MLALLFFVLYICIPKNKGLGILAMIFDGLAFLFDFGIFMMGFIEQHGNFDSLLALFGISSLVDAVMLFVIFLVFKKNKGNFN